MGAGRWLDAHDVVAGYLVKALTEQQPAEHAHEGVLAARLLEGICEDELACHGHAQAAVATHEATKDVPLACGCVVSPQLVEPFADLARAWASLASGDANAALGHALAAGLGRQQLMIPAKVIATRAEQALELLAADGDAGGSATLASNQRLQGGETDGEPLPETSGDASGAVATEHPSLDALAALVGLDEVKALCADLTSAVALEKERGDDPKQKSFSLVLTGGPGSGKTESAMLYGQLLGELKVVPAGRVVRVTGAQLQDGGIEALEEILEAFDAPGTADLSVGDTVEARRNGEWGAVGRIVHHDTSENARPQWKDTYDVHFGGMVKLELADGTVVTRRDNDFEIGLRRKDLRARDETGGILVIDDAHQIDPAAEKGARQVLYRLAEEIDQRGGKLAVVVAGYEKAVFETVLAFDGGGLSSRIRRRIALPDFTDGELIALLEHRLATNKPNYHVSADKYLRIAGRRLGKARGALGFTNARAVHALVDLAAERQTARVVAQRAAAARVGRRAAGPL